MSMNFTELRIFSFSPTSFSDFCLLFVLLVLRKGFVVEIFAVHPGTVLVLAVCSFPSHVLPVPVDHTTLQPTCSYIMPCEMWVLATPCPMLVIMVRVLTYEVLPTAPESGQNTNS